MLKDLHLHILAVSCLYIGKKTWPELVGVKGQEAAAKIQQQNPHVRAIVLLDGSPTTFDYRCDRVWVFVNGDGFVVRTPNIG